MFSERWLLPAFVLALVIAIVPPLSAADDSFHAPDSLILKNGRVVHGLIINNSRDAVLIQEKDEEVSYPKKDIVRIHDDANTGTMYTGVGRKGELPAWRVIANDLRTHDDIKSLVEVPATMVDVGEFKNVPYMSFRANHDIELNIYGDPENPAGFEIGIYGSRSGNTKLREEIRAFLAGFLSTRQEIAALYALTPQNPIKTVGNLTLELTPKNAPDAYGAWWLSLYNKKSLAQERLSPTAYQRITRPESEVVDKNGLIKDGDWTPAEMNLSPTVKAAGNSALVLQRGFYRDKNGNFQVIAATSPSRAN